MDEKVKPISPQEVVNEIPSFIIAAVNKLIQEKWDGRRAMISQNAIINAVLKNSNCPSRQAIFENNWLNIESLYRDRGWKVEYKKPAYCETWDACFVFTA